jgi:hypothetical protein
MDKYTVVAIAVSGFTALLLGLGGQALAGGTENQTVAVASIRADQLPRSCWYGPRYAVGRLTLVCPPRVAPTPITLF